MTSSAPCFDLPARQATASATPGRRLSAEALEERLDDILFAAQSRRSTTDMARALANWPRERQDLALHWAEVSTQTFAEIGWLVAKLAPRAFGVLNPEEFGRWVLGALDAYDRMGARPALDCIRDPEGYAQALKRQDVAADFASEELRLSRLLQGLSGRPLALAAGSGAWTDTETVHLPARLALHDSVAANRRLYKATLAILWAQTRFGSFGSAELDLTQELARHEDQTRALAWLAVLEAMRLEGRIREELPGLAADIALARGAWPEALRPFEPALSRPGATLADSLAILAGCMADAAPPPVLPHSGTLDLQAALAVRARRIGQDMRVLRNALSAIKAMGCRGQGDDSMPPLASDSADGAPSDRILEGDMEALPPEGRAAAKSLVQDLGAIPPECLVPAGPGGYDPDREGREAPPPATGDGSSVLPPHCDARYDEWDWHRNAYRKDWCHLFEMAVKPGDAGYVAEVKQRHAGLIAQVRRRFEMLRGESRMLGRQPDGEEIDTDALVEARTDMRCGMEASNRLFCRRERHERSLAAMFMVDMSGSTRGWINDAEREALIMLCEALETLGDAYAIFGFSGWTRTRCDIYRIKDFGDAYGIEVKQRIAAIEAKDYTRMGVAVRHLTKLLLSQPAKHRLLVTLSDGRPDDFGDEYRGRYGIEDTRRALQEAHARGVRSYCVTLDRHGADYLKHMYGPAGYTVLDDVKKLPQKIADIYRKLAT